MQHALLVEQIDFGHGLRIAVEGAQRLHRLRYRRLRSQVHKVGGHAAGGGVLVEFEQLFHFLPLFRLHLFQNGVGLFFGQLGQQVGRGSGVHLLDDVGDLLFVQLFQQRLLQLGLDLFKRLGGHFFIERGEHGFALGRCKVFKNVRQLRGVHVGQPFVLNAQLDAARRVHLDHVDKVPGNSVRNELARDRFQRGARQNAFENAAERAAQAYLYLGHSQQMRRAFAHPLQVHVVNANHLAAMNIDDLPVHQVLLQEEVVALVFQRHQTASGAQLKRSGGRFHHFLCGNNKQATAIFQAPGRPPCRLQARWPRRCL